jgi:hypothetical protein
MPDPEPATLVATETPQELVVVEVPAPPVARPAPNSLALFALGAAAFGALAVGALAIGSVAVGRLAIGRGRIKKLEIGDLTVRRLRVLERE